MWIPPAVEDRNGIISSYTISLTEAETEETTYFNSNQNSIHITGLMPFSTYFISVAASTSIGVGPFGTVLTVNTQEDG